MPDIGPEAAPPVASRADWPRTICTAFALLALAYACYSIWRALFDPIGIDFLSSWAAGRLVLAGQAASAYDPETHRAVELAAAPVTGYLTFPYPPPYLFVATPLGLVAWPVALGLFVAGTMALFLRAIRPVAPLPYALAHPAVLPNVLVGQNGFLLTAILLAALDRLARRPVLAGLILGGLVLKPQLALMLPVALIPAGAWRTIAAAMLSGLGLALAALIVFGPGVYRAFAAQLPFQADLVLGGGVPWHQLASPFAMFRQLGAPPALAYGLHGLLAATGAVVTWTSWRRGDAERVPILLAATMLASPYLYTYDTLALTVPLMRLRDAGRVRLAALGWLLCLMPVVSFVFPAPIFNTVPFAVLICLIALRQPARPRAAAAAAPEDPSLPVAGSAPTAQ